MMPSDFIDWRTLGALTSRKIIDVEFQDLFLAILSMDSYNQGYDARIADGDENDPDGLGQVYVR
ncbi:MAG: hypothetical protein R3D02_05965 [Hyphomicrobiales bacterium]